jgi:hypothetical protein
MSIILNGTTGITSTGITETSDGKVGIGTSSPGAKLDVRGSSTFLVNATNPTAWVSVDSALTTGSMYNQWNTTSNVGISGTYTNHPYMFVTNNTERMRILASGGITFNGDTAAANALDDYEEGTFTPALEIGGSTSGITYSEQVGLYVKIGTFCYVQITISLSSKGSNSGVLTFNNLPFLSDNTDGARGGGTVNFFGAMSGVNGAPTVYGEQGTYRTGLYDAGNSIVALSQMDNTNLTNSTYMRITYVYQTNS